LRQWYGYFAKHVATWKEGEDKVGIQNKVQSRFIQKKGFARSTPVPRAGIEAMIGHTLFRSEGGCRRGEVEG
jgi:hypothetical protein